VPEDLQRPNASYLIDRALKGGQLATPYALEAEDWRAVCRREPNARSAIPRPQAP